MEDDLGLGVALYKKSPYNKLKALTNSPAAEVQKYTTPALEAQKIKLVVDDIYSFVFPRRVVRKSF